MSTASASPSASPSPTASASPSASASPTAPGGDDGTPPLDEAALRRFLRTQRLLRRGNAAAARAFNFAAVVASVAVMARAGWGGCLARLQSWLLVNTALTVARGALNTAVRVRGGEDVGWGFKASIAIVELGWCLCVVMGFVFTGTERGCRNASGGVPAPYVLMAVLSVCTLVLSQVYALVLVVLMFTTGAQAFRLVQEAMDAQAVRPASAAEISSLGTVAYSKGLFEDPGDMTCAICLTEYEEGEELRFLPCRESVDRKDKAAGDEELVEPDEEGFGDEGSNSGGTDAAQDGEGAAGDAGREETVGSADREEMVGVEGDPAASVDNVAVRRDADSSVVGSPSAKPAADAPSTESAADEGTLPATPPPEKTVTNSEQATVSASEEAPSDPTATADEASNFAEATSVPIVGGVSPLPKKATLKRGPSRDNSTIGKKTLALARKSSALRTVTPKQGHAFHAECIDAWLQRQRHCPTCRQDIVPSMRPLPDGSNPLTNAIRRAVLSRSAANSADVNSEPFFTDASTAGTENTSPLSLEISDPGHVALTMHTENTVAATTGDAATVSEESPGQRVETVNAGSPAITAVAGEENV